MLKYSGAGKIVPQAALPKPENTKGYLKERPINEIIVSVHALWPTFSRNLILLEKKFLNTIDLCGMCVLLRGF